jgi:hypothetical protein
LTWHDDFIISGAKVVFRRVIFANKYQLSKISGWRLATGGWRLAVRGL